MIIFSFITGCSIYEAIRLGFAECAEIILSAEPEANVPDEHGRTPLHIAAQNGFIDCVQLLIRKRTIPVDSKDFRGVTPLMQAAVAGKPDVIQALIAFQADSEAVDNDGNTALMLAVRCNQVVFPEPEKV